MELDHALAFARANGRSGSDYRRAMVADKRVLVRLRPTGACGMA